MRRLQVNSFKKEIEFNVSLHVMCVSLSLMSNMSSSEMHAATLNGAPKVSKLSPSHSFSTPIRAISSKISVGPTSSGPPSSDAYERLVKALFRHRLEFSLILSAAYTYALVNAWTLWQAGGFAKMGLWGAVWLPVNLWTICITLLVWLTLPVPVVVLRKAFLTRRHSFKCQRPMFS